MCAIAGSFDRGRVVNALAMMKHRAPDDEGIVKVGPYHIGMGRLKIVDLVSGGLCPIQTKGSVLTFNGELYNYKELRDELSKMGEVFDTTGDSEVLLKAFLAWGTGALQRFNFMGAFAVAGRDGIYLGRDLAGEKPLYFRREPFEFASEAKALGFDCEELPPGHYGRYLYSTGKFELARWWTPPVPGQFRGSYEEALTQLDSLLNDSVKLRTQADVPYALYLSSGIDSTLISTYHSFEHRFTYQEEGHGEYSEEFKKIFPKILWHLDYPIKSFSAFGLWKLAEEASKKVKVVLSGEGADELFGGYVRYVPNEFNRKARDRFPSYSALFPYRDLMTEEFNGNMRELLRMGDRMASAFGIENRCPFLDRRIVEFAMSLPMEWKINGYETKVILKDLLKRRKPDYRPEEKTGLYCSVNEWLGSKDKYGKEGYFNYQVRLWRDQLVNKYV